MAGGADKARLCVLASSFQSCVYALYLARTFPYLEEYVQFVCHLVRPSSTTRHEHAMSDSSGKASSCCFVAACSRKFTQDLFL